MQLIKAAFEKGYDLDEKFERKIVGSLNLFELYLKKIKEYQEIPQAEFDEAAFNENLGKILAEFNKAHGKLIPDF